MYYSALPQGQEDFSPWAHLRITKGPFKTALMPTLQSRPESAGAPWLKLPRGLIGN